jgi:GT2 family glycosyltransferase
VAEAKTLKHLTVLLPTFRQPDALLLTLRDLTAQDYPHDRWTLVVVDDGSGDVSSQIAAACAPLQVDLIIRRKGRTGSYSHAGLFNEMLRLAPVCSGVFVHIEDVRLRPDLLRQHAKWHGEGGRYVVTGPMCEAPTETFDAATCSRWPLMQNAAGDDGSCRCCFQAVFAKTMSYSRELVNQLTSRGGDGPFDRKMTGWGFHETEFAYRAIEAGWTCVYDCRCAVYHPHHEQRDETEYRRLDSVALRENGTARNVEYLCVKHGLDQLPPWCYGEPL